MRSPGGFCVILIFNFVIIHDIIVLGFYKSTLKGWNRTNDTVEDLIYISTYDIPEQLSAFTFCLWFKQPSIEYLLNRSGCGVETASYIYALQVPAWTDPVYLSTNDHSSANPSLSFTVTGVTVSVSGNAAYPFYDGWMHICSGWSDMGNIRLAVKYSGAEHYDVSEDTNGRTSPISTSAHVSEGSWLMFHEQDCGMPYGGLNNKQCSYGKIAGLQLFSTLLSLYEIKVTGCGVRADIFDSEYDNWTTVGTGIPTFELEVDFCQDKWRPYEGDESPDVGMDFYINRNTLWSPQIPVYWPSFLVATPSPLQCFNHCNNIPDCRGWMLNKADKNCTLILNFDFMNFTMISLIEITDLAGTDAYYLDQIIN